MHQDMSEQSNSLDVHTLAQALIAACQNGASHSDIVDMLEGVQRGPSMAIAPAWEPQFDALCPEQEDLVIAFCAEIAGKRGEKGSLPDPVRLLEMAAALYKAERQAQLSID